MLKKISLTVMMCLVLVGAFFVGTDLVYADQLMPGIIIDGQSYAKQNRTALKKSLKLTYENYDKTGVTLTLDDKQVTAHFSQMGVDLDYDRIVNEAFALSHGNVPGIGMYKTLSAFVTHKNSIPLYTTINEQIQHQFLDLTVHSMFGQRPEDASLNITESSVEILPEKDGVWVDDTALFSRVNQALQQHISQVLVPAAVQKAEITADHLTLAKEDAQKLVNKPITLQAQGKKIIPAKTEIAKWIMIHPEADGIRARVDAEKIKQYLSSITSQIDVKATAQVTDKNGNILTAGKDGATLRVDDSVNSITAAYASEKDTLAVDLAYDVKNKSTVVTDPQLGCDANKAGGKYIEINLTMQKMCLYEGASFVNTFRVSTGKWSTPTPEGTFAIQNKISVAYSAAYGLYMPYWKAITANGEYGIHGLPYKGSWVEGQGHIGTPVSHGCIRLGPGDDIYVHNWADIGTPVYIHK